MQTRPSAKFGVPVNALAGGCLVAIHDDFDVEPRHAGDWKLPELQQRSGDCFSIHISNTFKRG